MDLNILQEGSEIMDSGIDYTRQLSEYPTAQTIAEFITNNDKTYHIYTKSLNNDGVAVQDSMEKYLSKDSLQSSNLKQALISPMHLGFSLDDDKIELEKVQKEKKHFELGTYLHECILEPSKFSRVIVEPKLSLASKESVDGLIKFWEEVIEKQGCAYDLDVELTPNEAFSLAKSTVKNNGLNIEKQDGKKAYYNIIKDLSGVESVSEEHSIKIQIIKKHYDNYGGGVLKRLLKHSKREISFYTKYDGMDLKVRPDALQFEENIGVNAIISIKSTSKEDLRSFYNHAASLNYDLSEAMYQEVVSKVTGRDFNTTIMIVLQTVQPFGIAVLVWSGEDIEVGKYKFKSALHTAKECKESGIYPGYEAYAEVGNFGLIDMQLPQWNNKELLPNTI